MRTLRGHALRAFPDAPPAVPRICLITPDGPLVTVRLSVDEGLRAAGRFWVLDPIHRPGRFPLLDWEMDTGDKGEVEHGPSISSGDLDLHGLSFSVRICAPGPDAKDGTVRIRVFQGDLERTIFPPAIFPREVVPGCDGKAEPDEIEGGFVFRHRP